ncbi:hypothetical protein KYC5002_50800 [Archangium violaceum]|uniref:hypothetical protein n=1 Tax=Archangium violaceum TaxID=83451 RepID=UPI002B2EAC62|nr:hypothetical protein KYC5002_50800 [Archangium gephyra]
MLVPGYPSWIRWPVLLMMLLTGCVTTTHPASYEEKVASAQVPASAPLPVEAPGQSPEPRVRPTPPVEPGLRVRSSAGAAARLLSLPAALLALLLWPSELEGETRSLDWTNTLNPVTLVPWSSQEEYDRFWQLPQQEREQLIQAGRKAMGGAQSSAATPGSRSASPAGSRRNPNQTCDDAVLDHLQAEKNRICNAMPGASCSPSGKSDKRLARMPCSQVRSRIQGLHNCIHIRQFIQDECFGGVPDAGHERVLKQLRDGLTHCLELEIQNCASGHPMADL